MASARQGHIGRSHGQRVPPLLKVIINTLRNYPDGSQILKELIQNSDDAGATEVEFLLDETQHSTEHLIHPGVAKYQGPALYAWNNAVFQEEDWEGIRDIGVSRKEQKVLKVGRFALGFISVYHITDFPCILSNGDVLLLDPHMEIDPTGGRIIPLEDFVTDEQVASHLESLRGYFGYEGTHSYSGTIFRFPLRTGHYETSLPNNVYNVKRVVRSLFEPFKQEVENCLLFMKSVNSVKVSVRNSSGISLLYSVNIDCSFRVRLNLHRKEMFEFVENGFHVHSSRIFISIFPTCFIDCDQASTVRLWLVMNMLGLTAEARCSEMGRSYSKKLGTSYLPWFAVALPLPHSQHTLNSLQSQLCCWSEEFIDPTRFFHFIDNSITQIPLSCELLDFVGNMFCFLPIAASSQLPFHIHGYFALSTNRRSIKWPRFDDLSDEASWNKELVQQLGTVSYAVLLHLAISRFRPLGKSLFHYRLWSCLPSGSETDELQSILHSGALSILRGSKLVSSKLDSSWIELSNGYYLPSFFRRTVPHEKACDALLLQLSQPLVELTHEVSNVIMNYQFLEQQICERIICPDLIREMLIRFQNHEILLDFLRHEQNVCALLEIVLLDLDFSSQQNVNRLNGIQLIPVCNSDLPMTFGTTERCFISDRTQDLLQIFPGFERYFVKLSIPHYLSSSLLNLSRSGFSNLEDLTFIRNNPNYFVTFLKSSMNALFNQTSPIIWTPGVGNQPDKSWMEQVWRFIDQNQALLNALKVSNVPLLPKQSLQAPRIDLLPLSKTLTPSYLEHCTASTYLEIEELIASSGCQICHRHPFILPFYQFVLPPIPQGFLSVLKIPEIQSSFRQCISNANETVRKQLIAMILSIDFSDNSDRNIIKSLPLFISMSNNWLSLEPQNSYYLPPDTILKDFKCYPVSFLSPFINQNVQLCWKIGINSISLDGTIQHHFLPLITSNQLQNKPKERNQLSLWILRNFSLLSPDSIVILSTQKWLLDSSVNATNPPYATQLFSPTDLFDPQDGKLSQLLSSDMRGVFPNEIYSKYFGNLKSPGLMSSTGLTYYNLQRIINLAFQNVGNVVTENLSIWFNALIELISLYLIEFDLVNNHTFWNTFDKPFIRPSPRSECGHYPRSLPFFASSNSLHKPSEVTLCSDKDSCLLAGVAPVLVQTSVPCSSHSNIHQLMGFQTNIPILLVCRQLTLLTQQEKLHHHEIHFYIKKFYKYFARMIRSNDTHLMGQIQLPTNFIYIPEFGFFGAEHVVLSCDDQLFPYLFSLEKYYPTYEENLTLFFTHFNIESEISFSKCQFILQQFRHSLLSPNEVNLALRVIQISSDLIQNESCTAQSLVLAEDGLVHPAVECVFNDLAWLKRSQLSTSKPIVHSRVSNTIASRIGCLPASLEMSPTAESIAYSFISDAGQSEDLVKRLRGILEGYRVHSDVFLELIQNSDDAGAKQVKILFDYTTHPCTSVLHKNMQAVHGPALYLFNDSVFTSRDFASILELSSGNKLNDTAKIGRFGVGFNAVYNFTDCPSFVSDRFVQIFDPLKKYIGPLSRDAGVRVCFTEDGSAVSTFHDQFKVYHDIFECDLLNRVPYQYTLFRLPFRMNESQLSDQTFNVETIAKLQTKILQEIPHLLLFLQNVNRIEVFERNRENFPFKNLLTVTKSECSTTHFLQENRKYFETYLQRVQCNSPRPELPITSADVLSVSCKSGSKVSSEEFLISYSSGINECFDVLRKFNHSDITFLPLCGVAIPLKYMKTPPSHLLCKIYTFLPLPIRSPLPLHINGYFSLSSSRKNLSDVDVSESEEQTSDLRTEWNLALINDALSNALIVAFETLLRLQHDSIANYYSLWPIKNSTYVLWKHFPECFARRIIDSFPLTELFTSAHDPSNLFPFDRISFLSINDCIYNNTTFIQFIFTLSHQKGIIFTNFPHLFTSTTLYKEFSVLRPEKVFDLRKLCDRIIFPNLTELSLENVVLIFNNLTPLCSDNSENWLLNSLCDIAFIPCGSNGSNFVLRKASDVVCPNTKIASLYQCEEMRIPVAELHKQFDLSKPDVIPNVLKRMGVIYDRLPVCEVISRCEVTTSLSIEDSTRHATTLIEYLSQEDRDFFDSIFPKIKSIPFIPTHKDDLFGILSISDNFVPFVSPDNSYSFSCRFLITPLYLCVSSVFDHLSTRFSFLDSPSLETALDVLEFLVYKADIIERNRFNIVDRIQGIYIFIAKIAQTNELEMSVVKNKLEDTPWIWHPDYSQFYSSSQVILSSEFLTLGENEYVVTFPFIDILRDENFKKFLIEIGIREKIDDNTIIVCIQKVYENCRDNPLPPNLVRLVLKLISLVDDSELCSDKIFLLNQMNILHSPSELFLNVSLRFVGDLNLFVHSDIIPRQALELGAKISEELFFTSTDFDESDFGVEEEITDRIQSLVRDIPMDALIKELIQNAEDSEASEIVFILDDQDYSEYIQTLSLAGQVFPNWKHLHSFPSLCVYNNKGFTEEDLKGIQMLSVGGKIQARKSIGKFGLGFNSVYQITDAPTFITTQDGQEGLTFCCFDPFIKYISNSFMTGKFSKKRGKKFDFESQNFAKFSDQLFPFQFQRYSDNPELSQSMSNLWNNSEFTMFRFPLDIGSCSRSPIFKQRIQYRKEESRKHCSLESISKILLEKVRQNSEILLFLNHVQSLKVVSIDKLGRLKLECSHNIRDREKCFKPMPDYFAHTDTEKQIAIQERECFSSDVRISNTYLIYSFPELDIDQYVEFSPELQDYSRKYSEEKMWGFGGVAVCISEFPRVHSSSIFTYLPVGPSVTLPVHLNAPFIIDSSRQHLHEHLSNWAEAWHSSVRKCILVPLYAMLLLDLREPIQALASVQSKREYFIWFYSLFPDRSFSQQFLVNLSEELYSFLYETNQSILLCDNLDMSDQLIWYPLYGPDCGIFNPDLYFSSSIFRFEVSVPYLEGREPINPYICLEPKEDELRESLILIQFPLSFAPNRLYSCLRDFKLIKLNQNILLDYLRDNISALFTENTYPCHLDTSVINFEQFQTLLEYVLTTKEDMFTNANIIPLRIDVKDNLRCFRKHKPSFQNRFSTLIPHRSRKFVSSRYNSNVTHKMVTLGYVKELNVDYLSKHLDINKFNGYPQFVLFWEFVVSINLNEQDLNKFATHCLVPVCSSERTPCSFFLIQDLKFVIINTKENVGSDPSFFRALQTLGCPHLDIEFLDPHPHSIRLTDKIILYLNRVAISQIRSAEIILGSLAFSSNLSANLEPQEVNKLYRILSQVTPERCNNAQLRTLSQLKLFKSHSGDYLALGPCNICFINAETLILGATLLILFQDHYRLVIFEYYYEDFLKLLCLKLSKQLIEVDCLLMNYVFPHLSNIPFEEQKYIIRFLSQKLAGLGGHNYMVPLLNQLSEIAFISHENTFHRVRDFYSAEIEFFTQFLPYKILPVAWRDPSFTRLFKQLGLKDEISLNEILLVATMFSNEEIEIEGLPHLLDTLDTILNSINFQLTETNIQILEQIGDLPFLPVWKIEDVNFRDPNYCSHFVKFCDAQLNQFRNCCCTTAWIHKYVFRVPTNCYQYLKIIERPDPQLVKEHLMKITKQIIDHNQITNVPYCFNEFFHSTYEYLEKYLNSYHLTYDEFRQLPCILWENQLYYPINMLLSSSEDLSPFVIQLPPALANRFLNFLESIGVEKKATYKHFALVLRKLSAQLETLDVELKESDFLKQAETVFNRLITALRELDCSNTPLDLDLSQIMLLTNHSKLFPCSEVIFGDNPSLLSRVNKLQLQFNILKPLEPDQNKSCVPPACLQLRKLTEFVREEIDPNVYSNMVINPFNCSTNSLSDHLRSPTVFRAMRRLYFHLTKKDLEKLLLKMGETCFDDGQSHPGFQSVSQLLKNLQIIHVSQIDLLINDIRHTPPTGSHRLPNSCGCYIDANNRFLISTHRSKQTCLYKDITYTINSYLGNIFAEVLSCFELCFIVDPTEIMEKLDDYNIDLDPYPTPPPPPLPTVSYSVPTPQPARVYPNYAHSSVSPIRSYRAPVRPKGISIGVPDLPAAKLWLMVSQCDILAAEHLITRTTNDQHLFPAHVCFCCFEAVVKVFIALLNYKGSKDRLEFERNLRIHLDLFPFFLSSQIYKEIEQLTIPLMNYDIETRVPSSTCTPGMGSYIPQQIFTIEQAREALRNASEIVEILLNEYTDMKEMMIQTNDPILNCLPSTNPPLLSGIITFNVGTEFSQVTLNTDDNDFRAVSRCFYTSMPYSEIVFIKKICNPTSWNVFKQNIIQESNRLPQSCLYIRSLFHGSSSTNPDFIINDREGFNMRFAQRGLWGRGIYFATNCSYSHSYRYSTADGLSCVFLASVFVGYVKEMPQNGDITDPPLMPNNTDRYHSVQGRRAGEVIHIVYKNCMAYPAYLITYKHN